MKNEIRITYPRTEYSVLNEKIKKYVNSLLEEFMEYGEATIQPVFSYTLDMYYEKYSYQDYLSYVFFTSMYTGGAHPNNTIHTVTYDKKKKQIVTISDLVNIYPDLLNILSEESRKILKKYPSFQTPYFQEDMLIEGTEPRLENFRNFTFSKDGLIIFFEQYQVAPYSFGKFEITIPYSKLF